jgi:hypothetical protein
MKKAIVILTGQAEAKNKFDLLVKNQSWVWAINAKNELSRASKNHLFWDGERTEEFHKFLGIFLELVNEYFNFEEKYIRSMVEKFLADEDEYKLLTPRDGGEQKKFDKFLLVIHGVNKELVQTLEEEYGAFQLHVTTRELNTNIENHDFTLYADDEDFQEKVENTINILTNDKQKEI